MIFKAKKATTDVKRSQRIRKQRMVIKPDQMGDCDGSQDLDYT